MRDVTDKQMGARLAAKLEPFFRAYQTWGLVMFSLLACKNCFILMLDTEWMTELSWFDCYIPGRVLLAPRLPEASKYSIVLINVYLIIKRLIIRCNGRSFNLYCLELCYFNHQHARSLVSWLPAWRLVKSPQRRTNFRLAPNQSGARSEFDTPEGWLGEKDPLLEESFVNQLDQRKLNWRPMRSLKIRNLFAELHIKALMLIVAMNLLIISIFILVTMPVLVTRRGFETTRPKCVKFIISEALINGAKHYGVNDSSLLTSSYAHIYPLRPKQRLEDVRKDKIPPLLPMEDFVPLNLYHLGRILFDFVENSTMWLGMSACYVYYVYIMTACCIEAGIYARSLHRQLTDLLLKWRQAELDRQIEAPPPSDLEQQWQRFEDNKAALCRSISESSPAIRIVRESTEAQVQLNEVVRIQASILDFYHTVARFNGFVCMATLVNMFNWLFFTFIVFVRAFRVDRLSSVAQIDSGVQVEFFILFGVGFLIMGILLAGASTVESQARQLYKAMISVMVHDPGASGGRLRWCTLLDYFEPRKLYCFTLFVHTSLSWLFCIKVSACLNEFQVPYDFLAMQTRY